MPRGSSAALRWAVALPFFVLPLPLIIDAPDVHGGYGGHLRAAVMLAGVGAVVGFGSMHIERVASAVARRPRLRGVFLALAAAPLLVVVGHLAAVSATMLADSVRDLRGVVPLMGLDGGDVWGPGPIGCLLLVGLALRTGLQLRGDDRVQRFIGVMAAAIAVGAAARYASFGSR